MASAQKKFRLSNNPLFLLVVLGIVIVTAYLALNTQTLRSSADELAKKPQTSGTSETISVDAKSKCVNGAPAVTVTWTYSNTYGYTNYHYLVSRATGKESKVKEALTDIGQTSSTSYTDTQVIPRTNYIYYIMARRNDPQPGELGIAATNKPASVRTGKCK